MGCTNASCRLRDKLSNTRFASDSWSRVVAKSAGSSSALLGVELDLDVHVLTAGDARFLAILGADADHEHSAHHADGIAVRLAVDADAHRRSLAGAKRINDFVRHVDAHGRLAALEQHGVELHAAASLLSSNSTADIHAQPRTTAAVNAKMTIVEKTPPWPDPEPIPIKAAAKTTPVSRE
jgi:hypothetical protein